MNLELLKKIITEGEFVRDDITFNGEYVFLFLYENKEYWLNISEMKFERD